MSAIAEIIITVVCSVVASSGFWAYLTKKNTNKDAQSEMLKGLAHDRIIHLGTQYIARGFITSEEYENLLTYLYEPYCKLDGNGSAKKVMNEVNALPFVKSAKP